VRVQLPDTSAPSKVRSNKRKLYKNHRHHEALTAYVQTFVCSPVFAGRRGGYDGEQMCIEAVAPIINTTYTYRNDTPSAQECTCYREIVVYDHRVFVCTSDGCFATDDHGRAGWSGKPKDLQKESIVIFKINFLNV
jgi:hypothetical protein